MIKVYFYNSIINLKKRFHLHKNKIKNKIFAYRPLALTRRHKSFFLKLNFEKHNYFFCLFYHSNQFLLKNLKQLSNQKWHIKNFSNFPFLKKKKFQMLMRSLLLLLSTVGMKKKPLTDILSCFVHNSSKRKNAVKLHSRTISLNKKS
jgi:hypothetical protein